MFGLYVHVPYCPAKCQYCDFYSLARSQAVPDAYLDALCREMQRFSVGDAASGRQPDTLYFGGGTPSLLAPAQVARLVDAARPKPGAEITLEANPETVTLERLQGYRAAGVNRLSIGVQTANDGSLARLGRRHTAAQSRRALALAAQAGFANVSGDMMLALPGYTTAELDATAALLAEGGATHISSYLLKIEPNTAFGKRVPADLPTDDEAADFYLYTVERLAALGYAQYEISNFAKPGFAGQHNLLYWNCENYLGLGPTAHSCLDGNRFCTPRGVAAFLAQPTVYQPQGACTGEDFLMLQLRLTDGLSLSRLREDWGITFNAHQQRFIQTLCQNNMARLCGDRLSLTPQGMLVQNQILCQLL